MPILRSPGPGLSLVLPPTIDTVSWAVTKIKTDHDSRHDDPTLYLLNHLSKLVTGQTNIHSPRAREWQVGMKAALFNRLILNIEVGCHSPEEAWLSTSLRLLYNPAILHLNYQYILAQSAYDLADWLDSRLPGTTAYQYSDLSGLELKLPGATTDGSGQLTLNLGFAEAATAQAYAERESETVEQQNEGIELFQADNVALVLANVAQHQKHFEQTFALLMWICHRATNYFNPNFCWLVGDEDEIE